MTTHCKAISLATVECREGFFFFYFFFLFSPLLHFIFIFQQLEGGYTLSFFIQTNIPFVQFGTFSNNSLHANSSHVSGNYLSGAYIFFPSSVDCVELYVGISFLSIPQAKKNVQSSLRNGNFDGMKKKAEMEWKNYLSRIDVSSPLVGEKTKVRTAFYHSLCAPSTYSESGFVSFFLCFFFFFFFFVAVFTKALI